MLTEVVSAVPVDGDTCEKPGDQITIDLTATEFRILATLMSGGGRVMSRGQLIDAVLGSHVAVTDRTIDVHVAALRKKLGTAAGCIQTVRGVGYTFRVPSAETL